ncbi:MAG TPA: prolyl oligopeptidase family serine peptidase, partial [Candidatus Acidoferrum sp.]|nr:prolyl oligopeptidase family serine peptidase [Candidatus Acidoferrum sp.]
MTLTPQSMQQLTEQLGKTVLYGDISISPDAIHVAWAQSTAATTSKQTYIRETSGNAPAKLVKLPITGKRTDFDLAWSPNSKTLAFFSSAGERDQRQLWIVKGDASDPKKITKLNGYAARPRWSHDGKQIAFLYIEGAGGGGPLMAAPATTGVIDTAIHNQRIAVLDIAKGQLRQVSPPDLHIYDYDWSPNDKMFVATAAPGPGDNNWWIAQIYTIDIAKGNAASIYKPSLQVAVPRWSPDGKSIAFIEGLMSDEGFHGGDLVTMSADGRNVVNRTSSRKTSINSFFWLAPDRILLSEYVGGGSAISDFNVTNNSARTVWQGPEGIHAFGNFPDFALSKDGKIAAAELGSYNSPPEAFAGPLGEWRQLTNNNAGLQANWGKVESIEWTNEGFNIQGWLVPPAKVEAGRKYPMVVLIHGGPSSVTTSEWPASFGMSRAIIAALSVRGYYVLLPNPRGSYGQGEEFTRANVQDFGGGDLRDDLAGVDAAIKKYPIDPNRLGVTGWSYGGFMTMWGVTQTNR